MEPIEYLKMEAGANGAFELPEFFFNEETDEIDFDRGIGHLVIMGYVTLKEDGDRFTYSDKLEEDYPEAYRLIHSIHMYEMQSMLDDMVDRGWVEVGINDEGEAIYSLTELGATTEELPDELDGMRNV